mmetsp:Transcript_49457/g.153543  ORF Transcript_49457/g.153543 Transcript_49457/m.153543 type:complete len:229 (-) Transcript_49457:3149-3835(-)
MALISATAPATSAPSQWLGSTLTSTRPSPASPKPSGGTSMCTEKRLCSSWITDPRVPMTAPRRSLGMSTVCSTGPGPSGPACARLWRLASRRAPAAPSPRARGSRTSAAPGSFQGSQALLLSAGPPLAAFRAFLCALRSSFSALLWAFLWALLWAFPWAFAGLLAPPAPSVLSPLARGKAAPLPEAEEAAGPLELAAAPPPPAFEPAAAAALRLPPFEPAACRPRPRR